MTSKAAHHIELRENSVREWVKDNTISVKHVTGKLNPAYIFTKEMRDGVHLRQLWDSFMTWLADFLNTSLLTIHHARQRSQNTVAPSAAQVSLLQVALHFPLCLDQICFAGWSRPSLTFRVLAATYSGIYMVIFP